jgi:hypothetical protein
MDKMMTEDEMKKKKAEMEKKDMAVKMALEMAKKMKKKKEMQV